MLLHKTMQTKYIAVSFVSQTIDYNVHRPLLLSSVGPMCICGHSMKLLGQHQEA